MVKLLLPIILLAVGTGAGIGAGIFLRPAPEPVEEAMDEMAEDGAAKEDMEKTETSDEEDMEAKKEAEEILDESDGTEQREYVKMNNQFVVPVVEEGAVSAVVLLALSIEVEPGNREGVILREPKLRDSFLQVLFDHANVGGFNGSFTDVTRLKDLRNALKEIAVRDAGDIVTDILILDIARQDY